MIRILERRKNANRTCSFLHFNITFMLQTCEFHQSIKHDISRPKREKGLRFSWWNGKSQMEMLAQTEIVIS
jgi:hypothetical protein